MRGDRLFMLGEVPFPQPGAWDVIQAVDELADAGMRTRTVVGNDG
ncbi:hypothetical protein [Dactylosporangium aurantiacum]|nr:hypothetical protein [Dactylosporangium aurantiacum]